MEHVPELLKIIEGALNANLRQVRTYTEFLAEKVEAEGNERLAKTLRRSLSKTEGAHLELLGSSGQLPLDPESQMALVEVVAPDALDSWVAMNADVCRVVDGFVRFIENRDKLISADLPVPTTLLLYGPPGCGKSRLARHIANRLRLPLMNVRLDAAISSFLGSTAKNIRRLFDHASSRPCVLFLDEFDAVAKMRDDKQELGELKRVVNSLIQNIDRVDGTVILIAATNHEHLLDPAIWRRFYYQVRVELPDQNARETMVSNFLRGRLKEEETRGIATLCDGLSGGAIEGICLDALRRAALENSEPSVRDVVDRLIDYLAEKDGAVSGGLSAKDRLLRLQGMAKGHLQQGFVAAALGVSRTYVNRLIRNSSQEEGEISDGPRRPRRAARSSHASNSSA